MAKSSKKSRKGGIKVDFEGVESGGGRAVKDGVYSATIDKVEESESKDGNAMLSLQYKLKNGARIFDNISLLPQALWRFKTLLECCGEEVPDGELEIDPDDLVGKELKVEVTNERWEGKDRPKVTGYDTAGEDEAEEEEAEEEEEDDDKKSSKKSKGKDKKKSKKDEEEEEEDDSDSEEEEEEEEEEDDKKSSKKKSKDSKKSKFKTGQKVKFKNEKGKTVKGVVTDVDGDTIKVEDKEGEEWELDADDEIEAA
jgi:hypothetical protein